MPETPLSAPAPRPSPKPPFDLDDFSLLTKMREPAWREWLTKPRSDGADSYAQAFPRESLALLRGMREGVDVGFTGDRTISRHGANLRSATSDPRVEAMVTAIIDADVAAGKKAGPFDEPPFPAFNVSPIGAVPKGGSWEKIRVIHHLSYPFEGDSINANIAWESLELGRFDDACNAIRALGLGCFLIKLDVDAAYKQVPVQRSDRPLLGFMWRGKYYYELVLPFGLKSSGVRWEMYAAALHFFFQHHLGVALVIHYVDDFLFVVADLAVARRQMAAAISLAEFLGIPVNDKAEGPATCLTFLGIELDTVRMTMRLPEKRLAEMRLLLDGWVLRKHASTKEAQSLIGKLFFAVRVVRAGRAFLRRIITFVTASAERHGRGDHTQRPIPAPTRLDIRWWHRHLTEWNGVSLLYDVDWSDADKMELWTDACTVGLGAYFAGRWLQQPMTSALTALAWRKDRVSMPFLELYALVLAAQAWAPLWSGRRVLFRCDCQPVVFALNTLSSPDSSIQALLRHLSTLAARHGFDFQCEHIAGVANTTADRLSRLCDLQELLQLRPDARRSPDPTPPLPPLADM